jgi:hypothetical protein
MSYETYFEPKVNMHKVKYEYISLYPHSQLLPPRDLRLPDLYRQSTTPRTMINTLKYFRISFRIRRDTTSKWFSRHGT